MMRPPSKHGLDRKYKPWRRGKASSERARRADGDDGSGGGSTRPLKRPTNASLRNQLRGQRRLLAKLEAKGDGDVTGVNERIAQLERDIAKYEATEKEKKNAAKYHQVKFIERQKLARLEKSVKRQLQQLERSDDEANATQTSALQRQLQRIVLDQLYVAFYPADVKYIALFANGTHRAADDERGAKRRRGVWTRIRAGLLEEWGDEGTGGAADEGRRAKRARLEEAKAWVDLDAAKEALLSVPVDAYPSDSWHSGSARSANEGKPIKAVAKKKESKPVAKKSSASTARAGKANTATDGRFALSKELDGMFRESTTGEDYERERKSEGASGSSEDDSSSSEEDDADPLGGFDGKKGPEKEDTKKGADVKSTPDDGSSSSSSSSCASSSSSEDNDSSDSDSDEEPPPMNQWQLNSDSNPNEEEGGDDGGDDFFATGAVSTEEAFAQAQKKPQWNRSRHFGNDGSGEPRRDKSRGFSTQNQSRREFRAHKERQKRQRFG